MSNDYFDEADYTTLTRHTLGRAEAVMAIIDAIEAGFDKLPAELHIKQGRITFVASDTGAADAYLVSMTHAPAAYTDGLEVVFRVANTNAGASTINVNSLGVKSIRNYAGSALSGGELVTGALVTLRYDNNNGYFRITQPVTSIGSVTVNNNVKVSANDSTPGVLNGKLTAGAGVTLTEGGDGGNETLAIAVSLTEGAGIDVSGATISVDTTELEEFLAWTGKLTGTITSGTTAMTDRRRYRITGGTGTLPTFAAGSFVIVELDPATGTTVTIGRNSQTIDGAAEDDTYTGDGGAGVKMLYKFASAGAVTSEIIGSVP